MAKGYSKGRGGFVGTLVSQRFIDRDPASITRGGATIQAASTVDETVSTFTSSGTVTLACATTVIEYLIVAGGGYNPGVAGNVGNTPPAPAAKGGPQGNNSSGRGGGGACTGTDGIGQAYKCAPVSPAAPEGTGPNAPLYGETGDGGKGRASPLTGTTLYAGGGGGGGYQNTPCGSPGRCGSGGAFGGCYTQPACGPGGGRGGAYHGTIGAQAGAANKGGGAGGAGGSGFLTGQGFSGAAGGSGFVKILQPAICISASASGIFDLTDQLEARAADTWPNS